MSDTGISASEERLVTALTEWERHHCERTRRELAAALKNMVSAAYDKARDRDIMSKHYRKED